VAKLYQQHEAIPSGLVGDHRVLTAVPRVRWAIRGILSKDPNTFAEVSSWPSFRRFAPIGAVVAEEVLEPLRILAPDAASPVAALTFVKALEWELGDGRYADPEQAEQQGRLVNSEFLDAIKDRVEEAQVRDYLRQVQFLAHDGQYHPARELLVGHVTGTVGDRREDERLRAEFAPDSALLDQRYKGPAVAFFEACRGRLEAPVQRMVEWVISADNRKRRLAALNYLLRGTGQGPLGQALVDRGLYGTWLEDLRSSELFQSLETADQYRLAGLLKWPSLERLGPEPPAPPPPPSAESLLVAIHDWWQRERSQRLARYLKGVYPGAEPELNDGSTNSEEFRKGWMTLFLIGLTHTMGRAVSEQHRSFLVRCEQRGWLGMFASSSRDPARWMQFVEEYVDRQVDDNVFLQWMKQFVGIFAVSRYLDEHIEAFLAIERFRHPFSLTAVTRTRTAAQFQQGGVSAPSISGVLGMGACFVVRELVRQKVITNELAYPHCFVPVKRVRDLFSMMGCDGLDLTSQRWEMSRNIYSFACEHLGPEGATFLKDFDIPLQIVAEDIQLQQEVLRQQLPPDDGEDGDGSAVLRY
jgi:hypothetical protein